MDKNLKRKLGGKELRTKYMILIPVYDRAKQLRFTLKSFLLHYKDRTDYAIVIVEDAKNVENEEMHLELIDVIDEFNSLLPIFYIRSKLKVTNAPPLMNEGINAYDSEYIIFNSSECYHESNVLDCFDEELEKDPEVHVTCGCKSIRAVKGNASGGLQYDFHKWFQHTKLRTGPVRMFVAVISREVYFRVGGYDDEFGYKGVCFCDDDWRMKIKTNDVKIVERDDIIVLHQEHRKAISKNRKALWLYNKQLFERKWKGKL